MIKIYQLKIKSRRFTNGSVIDISVSEKGVSPWQSCGFVDDSRLNLISVQVKLAYLLPVAYILQVASLPCLKFVSFLKDLLVLLLLHLVTPPGHLFLIIIELTGLNEVEQVL